jgi:predicted nucleic acid-binding protein
MSCYVDTGFIVSLHSRDANSDLAKARMKSHGVPMAWTWLHEMEFRNAIRLQVFRKQLDLQDMAQIFHRQSLGLENGVYFSTSPALAEVNREVERLSGLHTKILGTRTLDILHVAHALVLGIQEFLTFDRRQADLAKAAGLKVPALLTGAAGA